MITRIVKTSSGSVTVLTPSTGACRARNPELPQAIRSATRLGARQGDRHADSEGATAARRTGRDGRHHHLQPDPLRARQTNRRFAVSHVGLGPTSSARSKGEAAGIVSGQTPASEQTEASGDGLRSTKSLRTSSPAASHPTQHHPTSIKRRPRHRNHPHHHSIPGGCSGCGGRRCRDRTWSSRPPAGRRRSRRTPRGPGRGLRRRRGS